MINSPLYIALKVVSKINYIKYIFHTHDPKMLRDDMNTHGGGIEYLQSKESN